MHIRRTLSFDDMLCTYFKKSPLLSAQRLIIWIINTVKLTKSLDFTTYVELWCRKEIKDNVRFAENIARKVVHFLIQKSTKTIPKVYYIITRTYNFLQLRNLNTWGFILLR